MLTFPSSAQPRTQVETQEMSEAAKEKRYWIDNYSGKTHNRHCRYYANCDGHYSATASGDDCKICGGASRVSGKKTARPGGILHLLRPRPENRICPFKAT